MNAVAEAMKRAFVSQLHPKMLLALLLPFFIALLGAIVLIWAFWAPLTEWLNNEMAQWAVVNTVDQWMLAIGLFSIKLYMVPLLAVLILLPLSGILGLLIAAIFVMPIVLRHLEQRQYRGIRRQGSLIAVQGVWNAIWVSGLFVIGWLFTMPLWLIPPFPVLLPIFWWAFAFTRILRVDSVIEHASPQERRLLWRRHGREFWILGCLMSFINLFPPAWFFLPVYSALAFAHFSLNALETMRRETVIDA
jgi:hypothetical protein